jgi:hypothetical protein
MAEVLMVSLYCVFEVENKWQIPRQDLVLNQEVLGEGEFGRVLKGMMRMGPSGMSFFAPLPLSNYYSISIIQTKSHSFQLFLISRLFHEIKPKPEMVVFCVSCSLYFPYPLSLSFSLT